MKLDQYFDRIQIISLVHRHDRRKRISAELRRIGLPSDRVSSLFFDGVQTSQPGGFPSIGAHGCFLSHLAVLRAAHRDKIGSVLILEDDVVFHKSFVTLTAELLSELESRPWDLLYFGHTLPDSQRQNAHWEDNPPPFCGAHCYAVSRKAITVLIQALEAMLVRAPGDPLGGPMPYDGALFTVRKNTPELICLLANPTVAIQGGSPSDIAERRWFDRTPGFKQIAPLLRKIRLAFR